MHGFEPVAIDVPHVTPDVRDPVALILVAHRCVHEVLVPLLVVAFEAALLLVDFFPASGIPHPPEAAGGVDWQAGLGFGGDREN